MSNIISQDGTKDVRVVKAANTIAEGMLVKLSSEEVMPVAAVGDEIYAVALEDAAAGEEVSLELYPFFDKEVRLIASADADVAVDDLLEPTDAGEVKTGTVRAIFRALEAIESDYGAQLVRAVQVAERGAEAAHIADASVAHSLNATFDNTEVEAALDALGAKINSILVVQETHNQTATS